MYKSLAAALLAFVGCASYPITKMPLSVPESVCSAFLKAGSLPKYGIENLVAKFEVTIKFAPPLNEINSKYDLKAYNTASKGSEVLQPQVTAEKIDLLQSGNFDVVEILDKSGEGKATLYFGRRLSSGKRDTHTLLNIDRIKDILNIPEEFCEESYPLEAIAFAGNIMNLAKFYDAHESAKEHKYLNLLYQIPRAKPGIQKINVQ